MTIRKNKNKDIKNRFHQNCPVCQNKIGVLAGGFDAICKNCGYKDPCCE